MKLNLDKCFLSVPETMEYSIALEDVGLTLRVGKERYLMSILSAPGSGAMAMFKAICAAMAKQDKSVVSA